MNHINNSLQGLINLFYLVSRDSHLDPELRPLVTQIQAELARFSILAKQLITPTSGLTSEVVAESKRDGHPQPEEVGVCL